MDNQVNENLNIIQAANKEMLDYFNKAFLQDLEEIQSVKTQSFEIDVKIDELEKTKELYAFKSTSRKSAFSPTIADDFETERSRIIDKEIKELQEEKETLNRKIRKLETSLKLLKKRLTTLNAAETAINSVIEDYPEAEQAAEEYINNQAFEFIEDNTDEQLISHGYNILMQQAFDNTYLSAMLDKHIMEGIQGINHKLELLQYLVSSDPARAKLTLDEIAELSSEMSDAVTSICNSLDTNSYTAKPIFTVLDDFITEQRDVHPECVIDANIECTDYNIKLHPVFTINLMKLLTMLFDNVFRHANATRLDFSLSMSINVLDASIKDNGIGISPTYLENSPWYSNLHKAKEIIFLLGGSMDISGDASNGTNIRFNFPVKG